MKVVVNHDGALKDEDNGKNGSNKISIESQTIAAFIRIAATWECTEQAPVYLANYSILNLNHS